MKERVFIIKVEYSIKSREIDKGVIKKAIKDYLDSVSGFYYEKISVEEDKIRRIR